MIKTVFITVVTKSDEYDAQMAQMNPQKASEKQAQTVEFQRKQQVDLNDYLEQDWNVLHADKIEDRRGVHFAFVIYKSDGTFSE